MAGMETVRSALDKLEFAVADIQEKVQSIRVRLAVLEVEMAAHYDPFFSAAFASTESAEIVCSELMNKIKSSAGDVMNEKQLMTSREENEVSDVINKEQLMTPLKEEENRASDVMDYQPMASQEENSKE